MSTMKKRIPMFLLALAMMVAMAVPTFADGFHPAGCGNLYLNITRSNASQSVYQRPLASVDKGIHNKTTKYGLPTY